MSERNKPTWGDRKLWQSQNFLRRPEFAGSLVDRTDIARSDLVVEIGPGKGIITQQLARRAGRVVAVEIDEGLATDLRTRLRSTPNIDIVQADFLDWNLPREPYKVFSNIPFNTTADTVRRLTEDENPPSVGYLIMQDKAAFRFMGRPAAKDSQASILLKPWFNVGKVVNIDRKEFTPVPKITAVLAEIRKRDEPLIEPESRQLFRDFVVYGYNQWQSTVLDAFKDVFTQKQRGIIKREAEIEDAKPTDLTLGQWLKLFEAFKAYVPDDKKGIVKGAEEKQRKQEQKLKKWHRTR